MKELKRYCIAHALLPALLPGLSSLSIIKRGIILLPAALFSVVFLASFLLQPENAWALQSHGAPEGLYVHQMAHVFFFLALSYLYWDIRRSSFDGNGWKYLKAFCVLMLGWNVVAFVGHAIAIHIDAHIISSAGFLQRYIQGPIDLPKLVFYVTKFDHLLAVPALFFLYIGMRSLYRSSVHKHAGEAGK